MGDCSRHDTENIANFPSIKETIIYEGTMGMHPHIDAPAKNTQESPERSRTHDPLKKGENATNIEVPKSNDEVPFLAEGAAGKMVPAAKKSGASRLPSPLNTRRQLRPRGEGVEEGGKLLPKRNPRN